MAGLLSRTSRTWQRCEDVASPVDRVSDWGRQWEGALAELSRLNTRNEGLPLIRTEDQDRRPVR